MLAYALLLMLSPIAPDSVGGLVSAYEGPEPEEVKQFRDWVVACDTHRYCEAVNIDEKSGDFLKITVTRAVDGNKETRVIIEYEQPAPAFSLYLNGFQLPNSKTTTGTVNYEGDIAVHIARKLADGISLKAITEGGSAIASSSLAGSKAAVLYIDDRQRRTGTVGAILNVGKRPISEILPGDYITLAKPPLEPSPTPDIAVDLEQLLPSAPCNSKSSLQNSNETFVRLDKATSLLLIPDKCASGAYNEAASAFLVDEDGNFRPAPFDADPGMSGEDGGNATANAFWHKENAVLETSVLARSTGDCGRRRSFVWDGAEFRLFKQEDMPVCGGRTRFVRTFIADTAVPEYAWEKPEWNQF